VPGTPKSRKIGAPLLPKKEESGPQNLGKHTSRTLHLIETSLQKPEFTESINFRTCGRQMFSFRDVGAYPFFVGRNIRYPFAAV